MMGGRMRSEEGRKFKQDEVLNVTFELDWRNLESIPACPLVVQIGFSLGNRFIVFPGPPFYIFFFFFFLSSLFLFFFI